MFINTIKNDSSVITSKCKIQSVARCYLKGGFSAIPVKPNSKEPAIKWRDYTEKLMTEGLTIEFFKSDSNIAVVTGKISNLIVVDVDDVEKFSKIYDFEKLMEEAKTVVKSPNGWHFWFSYNPEFRSKQFQKFGFDIKSDGCLITVPPSKVDGKAYSFIKSEELNEMPQELKEKILRLQKPQPLNKSEAMLQEILNRVRVSRQLPDGVYRCYCPAHDDHEPSLDIGIKDGRLYIHCWAGCSKEEILSAIGFQPEKHREDNTAQKLLKLVDGFDFWINQNGEEFVTLKVNGEIRNLKIDSREFRKFLQFEFYRHFSKPVHVQALQEVVATLAGKAYIEGKTYQTFLRIGKVDDLIELDLCNGKVVQITKEKIDTVDFPSLKFDHPSSLLPLPYPDLNVKDEDWQLLKQIINTNSNELILALAWLLGCFNLDGEFPILNITGEREGIGKSTATAFLKSIIDPSIVNTKPMPKTEDDLLTVCLHNHVVAFDNISHITDSISDALCRISTGSGLAKRKLFTDTDAVLYFIKKPIILNGIDLFAERRDLRRRCIHVELERIDNPKPIDLLNRQFQAIHPKILGWLIKAVQLALRENIDESLNLTDLASFVSFICRIEKVFPVSGQHFINLFKANRLNVSIATISENLIVIFFNELLEGKSEWEGSMSELYDLFSKKFINTSFKNQIPKDVRSFGKKIRRLLTDLENIGIEIIFSRDNKRKLIYIKKIGENDGTDGTNGTSLENQGLSECQESAKKCQEKILMALKWHRITH